MIIIIISPTIFWFNNIFEESSKTSLDLNSIKLQILTFILLCSFKFWLKKCFSETRKMTLCAK